MCHLKYSNCIILSCPIRILTSSVHDSEWIEIYSAVINNVSIIYCCQWYFFSLSCGKILMVFLNYSSLMNNAFAIFADLPFQNRFSFCSHLSQIYSILFLYGMNAKKVEFYKFKISHLLFCTLNKKRHWCRRWFVT